MSRGRVVVGMSGGVDSSVAAYLLKEQGFEVIGLFMKNWEDDDDDQYCSTRQDLIDAAAVADVIGVELEAVNFSEHYRERVFAEFLREYSAGRTPNPDVLCNAEIKFKAFLDHAMTLGADTIATGHYAQVREADGQFQLLRAADRAKDQSYFLHRLTQAQLARTLFPLGRLQKPAVRAIAEQIGLHNAQKKDSTGICFIGERPFREFLSRYLPSQPGPMQTVEGERVGEHIGLAFYTLGQRKGIGVGGLRQHSSPDGRSAPWFVAGKDMSTNTLTIAQGHEHPALFTEGLWAETPSWIAGVEPPDGPYTAKTRYRQADAPCRLERGEAQFALSFDQPQWAVTPGQSAVLYAGEVCLGGGVIAQTRAVQNAHTASLAAS